LKRSGLFITLEGIDGTGKSTQHRLLVEYLRSRGLKVTATREPGSTRLGEQIRQILLGYRGKLGPMTELALFYAARAQHLEEVIRPALARGDVVVCDRFNDASMAYQGYARGLGPATVRALDAVICGPTQPDLTLVLDLEPKVALARARGRSTRPAPRRERFETQGVEFQSRARRGYLAIARQEPLRVKLIDAERPVDEVHADICGAVDSFVSTLRENRKSEIRNQKNNRRKGKR
jgi:dTMP kinase